ncbi:hypothetical protein LINPERHAP1_LOCUS23352, partial [Linum perenne]
VVGVMEMEVECLKKAVKDKDEAIERLRVQLGGDEMVTKCLKKVLKDKDREIEDLGMKLAATEKEDGDKEDDQAALLEEGLTKSLSMKFHVSSIKMNLIRFSSSFQGYALSLQL